MTGSAAALFERAAMERRGPHVDVEPLLERLRRRGWTPERLVKNDLAEPAGVAGRDWDFRTFWTTIARLAGEMRRLGLPPIFIKCVREYAYCDANVDLLVPRARLREVARALTGRAWRAPEPWDAFEQLLIEREKIKLPAVEAGLVAAHLYGGVSWRYQSDIGLLRRDSAEPEPEHLHEVAIAGYAPFVTPDAGSIWLPNPAAEFVMQAAHVAFENYRLTVGEALHFRLLRLRAEADWPRAERLAAAYGCASALRLMDEQCSAACDAWDDLDPVEWPRTFPLRLVAPAFRERAAALRRAGRPGAALVEGVSSRAVWTGVSAIRRFRRWRRGVEDYRH